MPACSARPWDAAAFDQLMACFGAAAGRALSIDERVYRSEKETGNRNRAIAYLLLNHGLLKVDPETALDVYFRQCSIAVTAVTSPRWARASPTWGSNPVTGAEVFDVQAVRLTLSVMFTCGMYDYAGNWACDVGVPAKSGVGGGILGVINRQLGIASYSPRLDAKGNSVRGVKGFAALAEEFGLHAFDCTNLGSAVPAPISADPPPTELTCGTALPAVSISALSSAPTSTMVADSHIQVMKPITAPSEP